VMSRMSLFKIQIIELKVKSPWEWSQNSGPAVGVLNQACHGPPACNGLSAPCATKQAIRGHIFVKPNDARQIGKRKYR
jgi:hypothetical protein